MPAKIHHQQYESVERTLNRLSAYLLAAATLISVGVTLPRFAPGVPMSVDTTSHLYKIIFLQYWWKQGLFPFWSADWYAGSPALLLYPPLGYFLTAGISMLGIDPVFAYKLVDALFYCMAPATMYVLGKELGFSQGESALAALLFSLFPEVIENYLFFDRFPTVLAIPISCAFLIFFHRALTKRNSTLNLLLSIIAMSGLLLVHHLSALITGIVAVLLVLVTSSSQGVAKPTLKLAVVALGTFGITAFWLVPFLTSYNLFSANQFYNRNVIFPFLRFTYFGYDVASYLLGIAQFIFAAVAVQSIIKQNFAKRIPLDAIRFFPLLLAGMAFFQAGEIAALDLLEYLGEIIAALSFAVFLGQFVFFRKARVVLSRSNGTVLTVFWFTLFLWMGLGYYALPVLELPIISDAWIKTMDVYRIWLYLALPMSALSARGIIRSAHRILNWRPFIVFVLLVLAITPVTTSIALKINYDLNNSVNGVLPYSTANAEIPPAIINYFQNDASDGRILGINVPFWIYILPSYVNKTIIDGWYPQTKLITPLVNINDYRLDDLETAPNETARLNTWRSLVLQAQLLDITWVIIGDNGVLAHSVMHDANFTEQLTVPYGSVNLVVYKSLKIPAFVTTVSGNLNMINTVSSNPDRMTISFQPSQEVATIMVKEAYFPTWTATADANPVVVGRDSATGYILLTVPAGTSEISLYQTTNYGVWDTISLISLIVCLALSVALLLRLRKPGE